MRYFRKFTWGGGAQCAPPPALDRVKRDLFLLAPYLKQFTLSSLSKGRAVWREGSVFCETVPGTSESIEYLLKKIEEQPFQRAPQWLQAVAEKFMAHHQLHYRLSMSTKCFDNITESSGEPF